MKLLQVVLLKVADPDGPHPALGIELLHILPGLLPTLGRPVNQVEVDVVGAQPVQALLEGLPGPTGTDVVVPQLGGQEDVPALQPGIAHPLPHGLLIAVDHRRVDVAVPGLEGPGHRLAGGLPVRGLEDAQSQLGNINPIVQGDHGVGDVFTHTVPLLA